MVAPKTRSRALANTLAVIAASGSALFLVFRTPSLGTVELAERWAEPPSRFVDIDGLRVHLRDEGRLDDSHAVVMIHGAGANLHVWSEWAASLRDEHRVITFDLPGFGLSDPFPARDYSVERYVRFVAALLDERAIDRATLIGRAFGGEIAWRSAIEDPMRVQKLVLLASAGYPIDQARLPLAFRLAKNPILGWVLENITPRALTRAATRNAYGVPEQLSEAWVDCFHELMLHGDNRRTLTLQRRQLHHGSASHRISEVGAPTLILWGTHDRVFPLETGRRFARDIANSQLVVFDHLGHIVHIEEPERTVAPVRQFLGGE